MTIEVTITGDGLRKLAALNGQLDDAIGDGLTQAGAVIAGQAGKNAFEFRYKGQLHRSYAVDIKHIGNEHTAHIGSNLNYAVQQEFGRKPGPIDAAGQVAIRQWVMIKIGDATAVYPIIRKIIRKGTPARRNLGKALETNASKVPGIIERAITKRLDAL